MSEKITVQLSGQDGNAFSILSRVRGALIDNGQEEDAKKFIEEATSGDYNHLLHVCTKYVNVE